MDLLQTVLNKIRIRYPGAEKMKSLRQLINEQLLVEFLKIQYPDSMKNGHVQFIPELRTAGHFLRKNVQQEHIVEKHEPEMTGIEQEVDVQALVASLQDSAILQDRSLVVFTNFKKQHTVFRSDRIRRRS